MSRLSPREEALERGRPPDKPPARSQNRNTQQKKDKKQDKGSKSKSLRYPYAMLTDDTDYLRIDIADYVPSGAKIEGLVEARDVKDKDGTRKEIVATNNFETKFVNSIALNTATKSNAKQLKKPLHQIVLPIPQQITDTNSVNWDNSTLNPLEAFGVSAAGSIMGSTSLQNATANVLSAVNTVIGVGKDAIANESTRQAITAALAGAAVGAAGGNVSGSQLVSRATGQVFNPNLELLFQGVNLRSFPFSFQIFPRNRNEAEVVKEIIRVLKMSMAAKKSSTNSGIFISAPRVFQLTYMKGKDPHPFLNKFLPMALTSMNLSYTASNTYSTFYDGTPTHMKLDLVFKELNPIYFEDYEDLISKNDTSVGY
jgi:predicted small secreted protein